MSEASETVIQVSWNGVVMLAGCLVAGLLLWAAGRRLLRPGLVTVGLVVGGAAGWTIGTLLDTPIPGWAFAAVAAVVAGVVAWAAARMAVTAVMAIVVASLSASGVWVAGSMGLVDFQPTISIAPDHGNGGDSAEPVAESADPTRGLSEQLSAFIREALARQQPSLLKSAVQEETAEPKAAPPIFELNGDAKEQFAAVAERFRELWSLAVESWRGSPEGLRQAMTIAAIAGALAGVVLGVLAGSLSTMLVTAAVGAVMMLTGALGLGGELAPQALASIPLPRTAPAWGLLWLITFVPGVVIQWTGKRRAADKPR